MLQEPDLTPGVEPGSADPPPCFQIVEVKGIGGGKGPRYTVDVPDKNLWITRLYAVHGCVQWLPELQNSITQLCEYETRRRERRKGLLGWRNAGEENDPHHQFCFELKTFIVCQLAPFYEDGVTPALQALLERRIKYLNLIRSNEVFPSEQDGTRNLHAIVKNVRQQLESVLRKVCALTASLTLG